eukprot:3275827-Amphidinium_carterae.2
MIGLQPLCSGPSAGIGSSSFPAARDLGVPIPCYLIVGPHVDLNQTCMRACMTSPQNCHNKRNEHDEHYP